MKWLLLIIALFLTAGLLMSIGTAESGNKPDTIEINRIVMEIEDKWPAALTGQLPDSRISYSFIPVGQSVNSSIANRDTLVDVFADGKPVGKVAVINDSGQRMGEMKTKLIAIFYVMTTILAISCGLFALRLHNTILKPFRKMKEFASRVAQGDLSFPVEMDRQNRFGAFSESFDLMRDQLVEARESERLANISKKELVASLSHDIKTPVSSIKVIAELYQQKHGEVPEMVSIASKADQIDMLISNMFTATLEELRQLKVTTSEITSAELESHIRASDYQGRVRPFSLPECIVTADALRFRQVIDNIIGNSYKYADTDIEVSGGFDGEYFTLVIRDFGKGVSHEELPLVCEKFYRAKNAEGKSGSGLGLYISRYFLDEMGGSLSIKSHDGLWAIMKLKI